MKRYARLIDGRVAQVVSLMTDANGDVRSSLYSADFLAQLVEYPLREAPPEPTHAELWERAIAEMRKLRQPILAVLDGLQTSALTLGLAERAEVIETAKQGLRDMTKLDLSGYVTYEEMRAAVGQAYYALVASLPADIRIAFKEATQ